MEEKREGSMTFADDGRDVASVQEVSNLSTDQEYSKYLRYVLYIVITMIVMKLLQKRITAGMRMLTTQSTERFRRFASSEDKGCSPTDEGCGGGNPFEDAISARRSGRGQGCSANDEGCDGTTNPQERKAVPAAEGGFSHSDAAVTLRATKFP